MTEDIFGDALLDYQSGRYAEDIATHSSLGEEDTMPLPYLFRKYRDMPLLEQKALDLCSGSVLDIGSGAGSHSLYLQQKGLEVTALDRSLGAVKTGRLREIQNVVHFDIYNFFGTKFDTLLLLMNGLGIAGRLNELDRFFSHLKSLLKPNGQILLDSSDIIYMFQADEDGEYRIPDTGYYGEVVFTLSYKGRKSEPFPWLYIDFTTLLHAALANDLDCELICMGIHHDYLARLAIKS